MKKTMLIRFFFLFTTTLIYSYDLILVDKIDLTFQKTVLLLNQQIVDAIYNDDIDFIYKNIADEFKEQLNKNQLSTTINTFLEVKKNNLIDKKKILLKDQYLVTTKKRSYDQEMIDIPSYNFKVAIYLAGNINYFIFMTSEDVQQTLFYFFSYVKQRDNWKLFTFHLGRQYKILNKTAIEWYEEAKKMGNIGHAIPAILVMQLVGATLNPTPFIYYNKLDEIQKYSQMLQNEVSKKYSFPIKMGKIKTEPAIWSITNNLVETEYVPTIIYVTKNAIDDEDILDKEAKEMLSGCKQLFPGIDLYTKHICFAAYKEAPLDSKKVYNVFRTVLELPK